MAGTVSTQEWNAERYAQNARFVSDMGQIVLDLLKPQSGERIHTRRNLQALRGHHPGKPSGFHIGRITGAGDLWVTEYVINYEGKPFQTVSIMEFQNGRVIHEVQYFAEPFEAPAWRAEWVEPAA